MCCCGRCDEGKKDNQVSVGAKQFTVYLTGAVRSQMTIWASRYVWSDSGLDFYVEGACTDTFNLRNVVGVSEVRHPPAGADECG